MTTSVTHHDPLQHAVTKGAVQSPVPYGCLVACACLVEILEAQRLLPLPPLLLPLLQPLLSLESLPQLLLQLLG